MSGFHLRPERRIPVAESFDVVVVGGGPSGCAAAVAAARLGARTLLVEKEGFLGGATVTQFVMPVLSMNGVDLQGVWHEWMFALDRLGGVGDLAERRGRKVDGSVDGELVKYAWDELVAGAGAEILHHAWASDVVKRGRAVAGVVLETVAGPMAVAAHRVVDATGDGLVGHMAGVPWEQGDGRSKCAMAVTKPFLLGNARMPEGFPTPEHLEKIDADYAASMARGEFTDPIITSGRIVRYLKAWTRPHARRPEMLVGGPSRILGVDPLDPWQLSEAERASRRQIAQVREYYLNYCPGCEDAYFQGSAPHLGVRSSRRLAGIDRVGKDQAFSLAKHPDGIAKSSWHIDIWPADSHTADADRSPDGWLRKVREEGDYFDIPYGCVVADGVDNLLMAGRCVSADHWAQASLRIQQTCQSTGQAAGVIAALSLKHGKTPADLPPQIAVEQLDADRAAVKRFA